MFMSRLLDVAPVKDNFQIVISKKMRELFDVKEGDFKKLDTTVEPKKRSR